MKNLLISLLCLITLPGFAQTTQPGYIKKLANILQTRQIPYRISFSDSIKFKHPYITHGKSLGILIVTNSKYPNCTLKYYVYQYTNKDSIARDILRFYGLREGNYFAGPYNPFFYMNDYVFFTGGWVGGDIATADDRVKYMSIYLAGEMDMYMKYDRDKY